MPVGARPATPTACHCAPLPYAVASSAPTLGQAELVYNMLSSPLVMEKDPDPMSRNDDVQEQKRMGLVMQVLAWVVFLGIGGFYFSDLLERQLNPNQTLQTNYTQEGGREVVLQRNKFGHYVTSGEINGQPVTFLLDTGATGVAIPESTAERLGLQRGQAYRSQTANGTAIGYATSLDLVAVGDIQLRNVRAGIAPGLQSEQVLLGMTFLKHIEFSQRGDTLILRQYN